MSEKHIGKVIQVIGPVLDIQFKDGELPELLNAIEIDNHGQKLVVEVAQLTGDNVARCIAMSSTDGLVRGTDAVDTGTAEVREVYKISSAGTIAGSLVTSGNIRREGKVRLVRDGKQLADVPLKGLKRFKDDVKDVSSGYECGISLEGWDDIQPGDVLECYVVEEYRD